MARISPGQVCRSSTMHIMRSRPRTSARARARAVPASPASIAIQSPGRRDSASACAAAQTSTVASEASLAPRGDPRFQHRTAAHPATSRRRAAGVAARLRHDRPRCGGSRNVASAITAWPPAAASCARGGELGEHRLRLPPRCRRLRQALLRRERRAGACGSRRCATRAHRVRGPAPARARARAWILPVPCRPPTATTTAGARSQIVPAPREDSAAPASARCRAWPPHAPGSSRASTGRAAGLASARRRRCGRRSD